MSAFFITGTGTDIGKTYVTSNLVRHLRTEGRSVLALKPVASGFQEGTIAGSDTEALLDAMDLPHAMADRISPWRFAAPLSPDMAASREGRTISFEQLVAWCRDTVHAHDGVTLIEGVGGVMVPLNDRHTVRDWMAGLGLPAILVAGTYLGTLSHTLTAIETLERARLHIAVVVLNESAESPTAATETAASLRHFTGAPISIVRRHAPRDDFAQLAALALL